MESKRKWGDILVLAKKSLYDICEGLKHKFLYNNDINSIHILLNLYDVENNISCMSPKYMSTDDIKRKVKRVLIHRNDRELVSNKIIMLIHDDIDRLELNFHLEGYTNGYYDNRNVNNLEGLSLQFYPIERFYEYNYLFHYNSPYKSIKEFKNNYFELMDKKEEDSGRVKNFIINYSENLIKSKIFRLNENLDKQLKFEFINKDISIKEEETFLSIKELNEIYEIIIEILFTNVRKIYKEASWYGLNDKLLKRY